MPQAVSIGPLTTPRLPVEGGGAFHVRRIFCVGRNYAAHAREMGGDPEREPPFFFTKPADAAAPCPAAIPYPTLTRDLHHEVELVVALGDGGADLSEAAAAGVIFGYAVGVDLTRRDMQAEARAKGQPWDMSKGFDHSAPVGPIRAAPHEVLRAGAIGLWVNDRQRQGADLSDLIWSVPEILSILSRHVRLSAGDLVFTGTPSGVGPLVAGDRVRGEIAGLPSLTFDLVAGA